jgi:hypothetical protein
MRARTSLLLALVAGAAFLRLAPHAPNFSPVAALALFAGAHFESRRLAWAAPVMAMVLSDLALEILQGAGFHAAMPAVYASFIGVVAIGRLLRAHIHPVPVAAAALASSVLFFIVTNFAVWLQGGLYPATWHGLLACYVAGIPFFGWTVLGDLSYSALLFGGFALAEKRFAILAPAT